ncbi:MAG: hypothetical protein WCZ27_03800 [Tissierellaceae bacterium]
MGKEDKKSPREIGLAENKDVFPPRGSAINIPNELLYGTDGEILDKTLENKSENIGSDLYKKAKKNKG